MDDRLDEILDRLRDLDHRLTRLERWDRGLRDDCDRSDASRWRSSRRDERDRDEPRDRRGAAPRGGDFEEKRVIDTIVRLVCENLAPIVQHIVARELDRRAPPARPAPPDDAGEPR